MGKELPGKRSATQADEMITTKSVDKTPGKATMVDDAYAQPYNLLSPDDRKEMVTNTRFRINAAGGFCNTGIESAKNHILMKKAADLPVWLGMVIDIAFDFASMGLERALLGLRTGRIKSFADKAHDATMGGHFAKADKADASKAIWQSISEESLKKNIRMVTFSAKFQARPAVATALADSQKKAQEINYIAHLQTGMNVAFQVMGEEVVKACTDAELEVLFHAFDAINHSSDSYQRAALEKAERYFKSGVDRLGKGSDVVEDGAKGDWVGNLDIERRVAWVKDPKGEQSLWFYEKAESHSNARSHEVALAEGHNGQFKLTKPVPKEFWDEAVTSSEAQSGKKVSTLEDSAETRAVLGVPKDYASSIKPSKVNSKDQQDDGAIGAHGVYNRLFGGM